MQTVHTVIGSMTVDSESGEAYDKIAAQRQQLAPREPRPVKRKAQLSIELEARLVRAAMSNSLTLTKLAAKLGIKPSAAAAYLKQLGLEKMVLKERTIVEHRRRGTRSRRALTH